MKLLITGYGNEPKTATVFIEGMEVPTNRRDRHEFRQKCGRAFSPILGPVKVKLEDDCPHCGVVHQHKHRKCPNPNCESRKAA